MMSRCCRATSPAGFSTARSQAEISASTGMSARALRLRAEGKDRCSMPIRLGPCAPRRHWTFCPMPRAREFRQRGVRYPLAPALRGEETNPSAGDSRLMTVHSASDSTPLERDARLVNARHGTIRPGEIAIGVIIGRTGEFFDFFVYAIASVLVFPQLVFPYVDALTGTLYSF